MREKRIRGSDVLHDIKIGMTETDLKVKYQLSQKGIDKVFKKLISTNFISQFQLLSQYPSYKKRIDHIKERQAPRVDLTIPLTCYEVSSGALGIVRDISTTGLRVAGIEANIGDAKVLQLPVDMFINADPLLLCVNCTWVETRGLNKKYTVAGFKIADLSRDDVKVLENLIQVLILAGSGEWQALK